MYYICTNVKFQTGGGAVAKSQFRQEEGNEVV